MFFPDSSATSASDLAMTFREEDPATSSQPFYVQGRERLRTRGERNQAAAMAEGGFAQTSQTDRGASERQDAAEQVSAAKIAPGHKTWAGRVAVPANFLFRGANIEDTVERAITPAQLADLWAFIQHVVEEVEIVETFKRSALYDQRLTRENLEMHSVNKYFVKPLTEPHKCSFVDLVSAAEAQPPKWFVSHAWSTPFSQTVSMLRLHMQSRDLPPTTPYWICTFANNQHDLGQPL